MPIDAIIFDKDGTLFDFANTWGGFGRSMLLRLSNGDEDRATELGRVIGYDFEQGKYTEDSIVIAATVEEIAEVLIAHVDGVTLQEIIDLMNSEAASAPQVPAVPLVPFWKVCKTPESSWALRRMTVNILLCSISNLSG